MFYLDVAKLWVGALAAGLDVDAGIDGAVIEMVVQKSERPARSRRDDIREARKMKDKKKGVFSKRGRVEGNFSMG